MVYGIEAMPLVKIKITFLTLTNAGIKYSLLT